MDLNTLKAALAGSPNNIPLLILVAKAAEDEFNLEEARQTYDRILTLEPNNPEALMGIARLLDFDDKTTEALVRMESLCSQNPELAEAWLLRAKLALKKSEGAEARSFYEQAIKLKPEIRDDDLLERIIKGGGQNPEPSIFLKLTWIF